MSSLSHLIFFSLQAENGLLGMGPFPTQEELDPDITNPGEIAPHDAVYVTVARCREGNGHYSPWWLLFLLL
jgi:acyl CoA:acetate/3-ketoacid CoA transferase beta subunit